MHVVRAFAPAMSTRGAGAIVLTASDLGYVGLFGWSVYSATKHAVVGFASSLRNELKPFGVSVQTLCPPATQTPGFDKENATKPRSVRKAEEAGGVMIGRGGRRVPHGRVADGAGFTSFQTAPRGFCLRCRAFQPILRNRSCARRGPANRAEESAVLRAHFECAAVDDRDLWRWDFDRGWADVFLPGRGMYNVFVG